MLNTNNLLFGITKHNLTVILLNIIIFFGLQFLFFYYIMQYMYADIIKDKVNTLIELMKLNKDYKTIILNYIKNNYKQTKSDAEENIKLKNNINSKLTLIYIIIPYSIVIILLFINLLLNKTSVSWNSLDTFNVFIIILAYITEIYFFYFILNKYIFIGDINLLNNINLNLTI